MEEQRAKFETWALRQGYSLSIDRHGEYRWPAVADGWEGWQASAAESASEIERLRAALTWAVDKIDAEICTHQNTYRGGVIWTICGDCDSKWSDDRGGFTPYVEPAELTAARAALEPQA